MLECGDKIGDYTLAGFLGRGQFGEVWLAEKDVQFSTRKFQHALKFLFKRGDEINLKAVEAEIDTWIEASGHPNVMSVLDMIVYKEYIIIASEFAEGGSLKRWLNQNNGKAPSHVKALEMMTGILSGIEHLHSRNVVHRDLKPDNILLQGNFPRITDFGISRIVSSGSLSTVAMGSPFYMSPESFDGSKSISTDIWSAGVILYEMLTGEHPYYSDSIYGLVSSIRQDAPKPLPANIPFELRKIINTALQKDMPKRYPTARAMRRAIEQEVHRLKARSSSQPELARSGGDGFSDVTLTGINIDQADKLDPDKGKQTHGTSGKDTPGSQSGGEVSKKDDIEGENMQADSPLGWSQQTMTSDIAKLQELSQPAAKPAAAGRPGASFADSGFGNSQTPPSKKPWLLVAAVAGVLALGLGAGLVGLIVMNRASLFKTAVVNANVKTADTVTENPKPKDNKPNPPPGMVFVPGGTFTMGRDSDIAEEKPPHSETLKPFFMDIHEVTNEDYAKFVNQMDHKPPPSWGAKTYPAGKGKFPVVGVDWEDANAYAASSGKRLPTEEEWEFAARGTDERLYPWGDEWNPKNANVDAQDFVAVGSFPCDSPFKICDMVGNAWEWTASDFKNYDGSTPTTNKKGNEKTRRGNGYQGDKKFATATYRLGLAATGADKMDYSRMGFRCVKDIK